MVQSNRVFLIPSAFLTMCNQRSTVSRQAPVEKRNKMGETELQIACKRYGRDSSKARKYEEKWESNVCSHAPFPARD